MDLLELLYVDELAHGLANLSMFPYFDTAHYIVSVMALREQPGKTQSSNFLLKFFPPTDTAGIANVKQTLSDKQKLIYSERQSPPMNDCSHKFIGVNFYVLP